MTPQHTYRPPLLSSLPAALNHRSVLFDTDSPLALPVNRQDALSWETKHGFSPVGQRRSRLAARPPSARGWTPRPPLCNQGRKQMRHTCELLQLSFHFYSSVLVQLFFPSLSAAALYLCPHPVFSSVLLFMVFVSGLAVSSLY